MRSDSSVTAGKPSRYRDREFVTARARDDRLIARGRLQSGGHGEEQGIATGMAKDVVDALEAVETDHQQSNPSLLDRGHQTRKLGLQGASIGEPREVIIFRQISDAVGFTFTQQDVAQYGAILDAVGALPTRKAGLDRKYLTILASRIEFHDLRALPRQRCRPANRPPGTSPPSAQMISNGLPIMSAAS